MERKHTPGPWELDGVEIYPVGGHRATDAICEMKPGFSDADARLIEAAPALLEALQELTVQPLGTRWDTGLLQRIEKARLALALATGAA